MAFYAIEISIFPKEKHRAGRDPPEKISIGNDFQMTFINLSTKMNVAGGAFLRP